MREPRRDWNAYGLPRSTPVECQYVIMTNKMLATFGVKSLAFAFNKDEMSIKQRLLTISSLSKPAFPERMLQLKEVNADITLLTAEDTALLDSVVAILIDERVIQIYDMIFEMWSKELASSMEVNYFLHVWQIFATSPFHNAVVLVDQATADLDAPLSVEATVVGKFVEANGDTRFNVSIALDGPSFVGNVQFVQTTALATAGIRVSRDGSVAMTTASAGGALVASLAGEEYLATAPILKATAVGATFTLDIVV